MLNEGLLPAPSGEPAGRAIEGFFLTDLAMHVIATDRGARQILGDPDNGSSEEILAGLPDELKVLLIGAASNQSPKSSFSFRVRELEFKCRVFLLQQSDGSRMEPMLAVHLHKVVSLSDAVQSLSKRFHLTDREQIVLFNIALGATGKEAAEQMSISPNTVKSFVKSIMLKLNVTSRAAVIGKLLEHSHNN